MHRDVRSLNLVWLSRTGLTNLNSGEGGSNYVDVKRYRWHGEEFPYVSGQAMRYVLREAIRREVRPDEACVADERGVTCGQIDRCVLCDLFGYMNPIAEQGATTRVSPLKVSPAMGLLPMAANGVVDYLTRRHRLEEAGRMEGDIVNVEMGVNLYKAGLALDVQRVGAEEAMRTVDQDQPADGEARRSPRRTLTWESRVDETERDRRIRLVLQAVGHLADFSKQARALTDFSPDLMLATVEPHYSHRLQKALDVYLQDGRPELDVGRLVAVLEDVVPSAIYVGAGMIEGVVENQSRVKEALQEVGVPVDRPGTLLERVVAALEWEADEP